jgi:predicted  nucleic acid-binding Zn-ribbon protein
MSLIQCTECGKDVSTQAKTCPNCGAKVKKPASRVKKMLWGFVTVVFFAGIIISHENEQTRQAQESALTPEQKAQRAQQEKYEEMAKQGARKLKLAMKDPESFEIKSLIVMKNGTSCYKYRATNSYNAKLQYSAVLTSQGEIFTQEHQQEKFIKIWNKDCTQPGGVDLTDSSNLQRWLKI